MRSEQGEFSLGQVVAAVVHESPQEKPHALHTLIPATATTTTAAITTTASTVRDTSPTAAGFVGVERVRQVVWTSAGPRQWHSAVVCRYGGAKTNETPNVSEVSTVKLIQNHDQWEVNMGESA